MVTLKEIAKECGVSTATVSNILNGKKNVSQDTRNKVMQVIHSRGYKPNMLAKGLRKQKTYTIGLIAEDITQFTVPYIVDGAMLSAENRGYRTVVQNLRLYARWHGSWFDNDRMFNTVLRPAVQELVSIQVDGILYVAGHGRNIVLPDTAGIPLVLAYSRPTDETTMYTIINDSKAAYIATQYLTQRGHRKIGVISGEQDNMHTQLRLQGYQQALFEASILYNPGLVVSGAWLREGGVHVAEKLIREGVTAIFCMSDRMAGGVYDYCYSHGIRVGEDISIIGFDNEIISEYYTPGLTTMEIPLMRFGESAAEQLFSLIDGDNPQSEKCFHPELGDERTTDGRGVLLGCRLVERNSVKDLRR